MAWSPPVWADGRTPGSVLVYPLQGSAAGFFTIVGVTNTNYQPTTPSSWGGTTTALFQYVNIEDVTSPLGHDCSVFDRVETLTPGDTLNVLTDCHNLDGKFGYLVVTAQNPGLFKTPWSFNHLMGSELVASPLAGTFTLNAMPFEALADPGEPTDHDGDFQLDFDGLHEYEGVPDELYIDSFLAAADSALVLINLTGGTLFDAIVGFDIWNDDEFALSSTATVRCWLYERLEEVSPVFQEDFLANNTPDDPSELDITCTGVGEFETGWARVRGMQANSFAQTIADPALVGAVTASPSKKIGGGRLLWESRARQANGDFLKFGVFDPEN